MNDLGATRGSALTSGGLSLMLGDCLDRMQEIPDQSVDLVLADLPYGTTMNKWDSVIPPEPLWEALWRVCRGAVVLTAAQPFTSHLVLSQEHYFRYAMTWCKNRFTGNLNAKKQPMRAHEDVLVFYKSQPTYHPYTEDVNPLAGKGTPVSVSQNYGRTGQKADYVRPDNLTKTSVLKGFDTGSDRGMHPTQKPVALMEYLIRTYTNDGDTVLDNTMGSGSTGVACINTDRNFIGIERDEAYFSVASGRLQRALVALQDRDVVA